MAETTNEATTDARDPVPGSLLSGIRLDAVVATLSFLMVFGIALDFNSHAQGISFAEEGFFTPEHVFFYSMFLLIAATIGAATFRNRRNGAKWIAAVPPGYAWGVAGVLLFGVAGMADFGWHGTFGFEEGFEALTSPTHLLLASGAILFLSSPFRAAIRREERPAGRRAIPAVLSASLAVTIIALFSAYVNPYARPAPLMSFEEAWIAPNLGLSTWAFYPLLMVGTALLLVRFVDLPPGSLTIGFLLPAGASTVLGGEEQLLLSVLLAGVVADALVHLRPPKPTNPRAMRVFGALVPGTMAGSYFGIVVFTAGIDWVVHILAGTVVTAFASGLLVTYLVVPDGSLVERSEPATEPSEADDWTGSNVRADGGDDSDRGDR